MWGLEFRASGFRVAGFGVWVYGFYADELRV